MCLEKVFNHFGALKSFKERYGYLSIRLKRRVTVYGDFGLSHWTSARVYFRMFSYVSYVRQFHTLLFHELKKIYIQTPGPLCPLRKCIVDKKNKYNNHGEVTTPKTTMFKNTFICG